MSKGYWGPPSSGCVVCHSGPKEKFYCEACDHVCKAPLGWTPACPQCRQLMLNMGHRWQPGPKGDRFRHYPAGWRVSVRTGTDRHGYAVWQTRVLGAHGYHAQAGSPERRLWLPDNRKLRVGGRIISRRTMA